MKAARGLPDSNWGPPMSYAANVGQDAIIQMLREMGAADVQHAFERACLQGKIETARRLHAMGARPTRDALMGSCETLNDARMAFLVDLGVELADEHWSRTAPIASLLETYSRHPEGKHRCLELPLNAFPCRYTSHGRSPRAHRFARGSLEERSKFA